MPSNSLQFLFPAILLFLLILGLIIRCKYDILDFILALLWIGSFYYDIIWIMAINPSNLYLDPNAADHNLLEEVLFITTIVILSLSFIGNFLISLNSLYLTSQQPTPDSSLFHRFKILFRFFAGFCLFFLLQFTATDQKITATQKNYVLGLVFFKELCIISLGLLVIFRYLYVPFETVLVLILSSLSLLGFLFSYFIEWLANTVVLKARTKNENGANFNQMQEPLLAENVHDISTSSNDKIVLNYHPYIILLVRSLFLINVIPRLVLLVLGIFTIVATPYSIACFKRYLRMWSMQLTSFPILNDEEDEIASESSKRAGYFLIPLNIFILLPSLIIIFIITLILKLIITFLAKSFEGLGQAWQANLFQQRNKVVIYGFDVAIGLIVWQIIPSRQFPLFSSNSQRIKVQPNVNENEKDENNKLTAHPSLIVNLLIFCSLHFVWPIVEISFRLVFLVLMVEEYRDPLLGDFGNFEPWAILFFMIIPVHTVIILGTFLDRLVSFYWTWTKLFNSDDDNNSFIFTLGIVLKKEAKKGGRDQGNHYYWISTILFVMNLMHYVGSIFVVKYLISIEASWIFSALFSILFISLTISKSAVENLEIGQGYASLAKSFVKILYFLGFFFSLAAIFTSLSVEKLYPDDPFCQLTRTFDEADKIDHLARCLNISMDFSIKKSQYNGSLDFQATEIQGSLEIIDNSGLINFAANQILMLPSEIWVISSNTELVNITFNSMSHMDINSSLSITMNPSLILIRASSLTSIPSDSSLTISNNSLSFLDLSLTYNISGELVIENNEIAKDLQLFSLNNLAGNLTISNNPLLENLNFYFLSSIVGNLIISGNHGLQNLELISFDTFGGYILISHNRLLQNLILPFRVAQNNPLIVIDSNPQLEIISFPEVGTMARVIEDVEFRLIVTNNPQLKLVEYNSLIQGYTQDHFFENNGNFTIVFI